MVVAHADCVEEPLAKAGLQLTHHGVVGDFRNRAGDFVPLMLGTQSQHLARHQIEIALPISFEAVAVEKGRQAIRRIRIEIALIEFRVRDSDSLIEDAVERYEMRSPAGEELLVVFGAP